MRRARRLVETLQLARAAGARAGVTRVPDIGGLTPFGVPVFQAVRPFAKSLTVSQGKGGSVLAAKVSALLETVELHCAENLPEPKTAIALEHMPAAVRAFWSGERPALGIDLDPSPPRAWVEGRIAGTGKSMPMPWHLLALDFTRPPLDYAAGSDGLASGNSYDEALLSALCELVEHDMIARFDLLGAGERRALQIDLASMGDPRLLSDLRRVSASGFVPRMWSLGQHHGIAAIHCVLFGPEPALDRMAPVAGSACHPDAAVAALGALHEAIQGRASLVAGARDDITPGDYTNGMRRTRALAVATLAVAEGPLPWAAVPTHACPTYAEGVALMLRTVARLSPLPVAVFEHPSPTAGLHVVHALAPGLRNLLRRKRAPLAPSCTGSIEMRGARTLAHGSRRAILFAGPSIAGLSIPPAIELRSPAICGDLAALLTDPPAAVGLVDGHFGIAPTVWHKEILHLLSLGTRVLGAASIGALRAAELEAAGMEGVGAIAAAYRTGAIERDDAVMVLQAPGEFGFVPLTLSLVDAEHALATVCCEPRARRMMQRIVRTMPFERRTWARCLEAYRLRTGQVFPVTEAVLSGASSLKRQDAAHLLRRLAEVAQDPSRPPERPAPPMTRHYLRLLATTVPAAGASQSP